MSRLSRLKVNDTCEWQMACAVMEMGESISSSGQAAPRTFVMLKVLAISILSV